MQSLYKESSFGKCNDKSFYYDTIEVIDDKSFKISIEAGITMGWHKYTGISGFNIGIDRYGKSAPGIDVADYLGMSLDKIISRIKSKLSEQLFKN